MAEFNTKGLSAVSAFFGTSCGNEELTSPSSQPVPRVARSRHGVGSIATVSSKPRTIDTVASVLRVGERRRLAQDDDDDDNRLGANLVDAEEDEEEGRTAIAKESAPKTATASVSVDESKTKKKRTKEQVKTCEDSKNTEGSTPSEDPTNIQEDDGEVESKPKRKRRKIRSRQKNIYRDSRLTQHKPDYLIQGRADFRGRPLTAETRMKLHLPPSRSSRQHHHHEEAQNLSSGGDGMKLAIDDLLEDVGQEQQQNNDCMETAIEDAKPSKKKRKKKSKYKNLA